MSRAFLAITLFLVGPGCAVVPPAPSAFDVLDASITCLLYEKVLAFVRVDREGDVVAYGCISPPVLPAPPTPPDPDSKIS